MICDTMGLDLNLFSGVTTNLFFGLALVVVLVPVLYDALVGVMVSEDCKKFLGHMNLVRMRHTTRVDERLRCEPDNSPVPLCYFTAENERS